MIQVLDKYGNSSTDEGLILVYDKNGNIKKIGGGGSGSVTSIATSAPITGGTITSTGTIGITQSSVSTDGYLSSTDWNTFNSKVPSGRTLTINGTTYDLSADRSWTITASATSINIISTNTAAGSAASTDYVYLVSGTTTLTLPTAVGNTNLYSIKRVGTGVVSIATTSSQTIDGSSSPITINVQYVSITVVSDGANWNII
jgi:hypothetical protein